MDRKKFIHTLFRVGLLGTFVAGTAALYRNKQLSLYPDCPEVSTCKACGKFKSCTLPEAEKSRNNG